MMEMQKPQGKPIVCRQISSERAIIIAVSPELRDRVMQEAADFGDLVFKESVEFWLWVSARFEVDEVIAYLESLGEPETADEDLQWLTDELDDVLPNDEL